MTNPALSSVIVGTTDAATLKNALDINQSLVASPTHLARPDRFWATDRAALTSDIEEVLEVSYASADLTNRLSFDAVRFPHTLSIEYAESTTGPWLPILDSVTQQPIFIEVLDSYPPVLPNAATVSGHSHPQHDFDGHWTRYNVVCEPAVVQKLRFVLKRNNGGSGPVNTAGSPVKYSLGLQNIDTGYTIASEDDIPFHGKVNDTSGEVFANSGDVFGSNLGFSKKTHKASNLVYNTDTNAPLIWKSEPQPFPSAVVNFYADLRDAQGKAQTVDEIFIDPLYLGSRINLYYSNDSINGSFRSRRTPFNVGMVGASTTQDSTLSLGTWHSDTTLFDPYYVQVDNFKLGFDPSLDWWIGFEWTRDYAANTDGLNHYLFSCDAFSIGTNSQNFFLFTAPGDTLTLPNTTLTNDPIQVIAGYRNGNLYLTIQQDGVSNTIELPASVGIPAVIPAQLLIGTPPDFSSYLGGQISSFVLQQTTMTDAQASAYLLDPQSFSDVPRMRKREVNSKYNTLLRFDSQWVNANNLSGFVGGAAHPYEDMTWTPIPRTYEMQRGVMKLPRTKAKFWNLEITNLRPETNDKFVPVTRTVKTFPAAMYAQMQAANGSLVRATPDDLALNVLQQLSTDPAYFDQPQYQGTGATLSGISNTAVYVASDYTVQEQLRELGPEWSYVNIYANGQTPRFTQIGTHPYVTQEIKQTSNVSYFTGLRQIRFSKHNRVIPSNAPVIEEDFIDAVSYDGNWQQTDTGLLSSAVAGATYARATAPVVPTQSGVRGLQFAVHQSDAKLISVNGNFSDATYDPNAATTWSAYGDGKTFGLTYDPSVGSNTFMVSRQDQMGYWGDVAMNYGPTYGQISANLIRYADLKKGTHTTSGTGGFQSQPVAVPYGGRLHAAARITAQQNLTAPLYTQIVDAASGKVLSEAQSNVSQNEIKQWYASVNLTDFGASIGNTYGSLVGTYVWPSFSDSFNRANTTTLGQMDSGQFWNTPTGYVGLQIASNVASVPSTPARSEIDTGTIWGTMSVRLTTVVSDANSNATPLIDLGGIYLFEDGAIRDADQTATIATLGETLSTAHDYNFKFMPTSLVPGGQLPSGADASNQPYSMVITTGTLGSDTWLQTISTSRCFTTLRALMGETTTAFDNFAWTPGDSQYRPRYMIPGQLTDVSGLVATDSNYYTLDTTTAHYDFQGQYTYAVTSKGVQFSSLRPAGSVLATPGTVTLAPSSSGGTFVSGTYYYKVTAINQYGETVASAEASTAVATGGQVVLTWAAISGATNYNIYRGTVSGTNYLLGSSGGVATYTDLGDTASTTVLPPKYNTTNGAGTMQTTDTKSDFGYFRTNVVQVPNNMTASDVPLVYLDNDPTDNSVITLRANGAIVNESTGTTLSTLSSFNPTAGRLTIYYANTALLTSSFIAAHPGINANPTAIIFFQNGTTYLGYYSTSGKTWASTVRGVAGANNGTSTGQYTIMEGFNWNPDGAGIVPHVTSSSSATYAQISYNSTRTYGHMAFSAPGSVQNIQIRVVQKQPTQDAWFVQDISLFWDPVIWEFSCDNGQSWWEASDIKNDPNGVFLFPYGLTSYNNLRWRITSYAGQVEVAHLAIRPWYVGQHNYIAPQPSHLPQGPNVVPTDDYGPIDRDPRWMTWDKPVPHWWWNQALPN